MNKVEINLGEVDNSCFVVMPFSTLFQVEYEKIIQPALNELNIECVRGDEIYTQQSIIEDIWNSIRKCRFVLAELTGKNPNVLYEIGLAHAIGKPIVIITRNSDDVPFDLKALRYLFYDVNDPFWGENLKKGIQNLVQKIIENPSIDIYLSGITKNEIEFPELSKVATKSITKKINFTGTWQGEFQNNNDIIHKVTLQINQEKDHLYATAVISFIKGDVESTVQQMMTVSLDDDVINLQGINYTFIDRGNSKDYALDDFSLKHDKAKNLLTGSVISIDEVGIQHASSKIILHKI